MPIDQLLLLAPQLYTLPVCQLHMGILLYKALALSLRKALPRFEVNFGACKLTGATYSIIEYTN